MAADLIPRADPPISYPELIRLLPCWCNHSSAILAERRYRAATRDWSVATEADTVRMAPPVDQTACEV